MSSGSSGTKSKKNNSRGKGRGHGPCRSYNNDSQFFEDKKMFVGKQYASKPDHEIRGQWSFPAVNNKEKEMYFGSQSSESKKIFVENISREMVKNGRQYVNKQDDAIRFSGSLLGKNNIERGIEAFGKIGKQDASKPDHGIRAFNNIYIDTPVDKAEIKNNSKRNFYKNNNYSSSFPVPVPRKSLKFQQNNYFQNDEIKLREKYLQQQQQNQKLVSNKNEYEKSLRKGAFCMDCQKCLINETVLQNHEGHDVLPVEEAIPKVINIENEKIKMLSKNVKTKISNEEQIFEMANNWETVLHDPVTEILKQYKISSRQSVHDLHLIYKDASSLMQQENQSLIEMLNLQNSSRNIIDSAQKFFIKNENNPYWLITAWFKITLGLLINTGKKIFISLNDKTVDRFSLLELQGDRLLLPSLTSGITPNKNAVIIPYDFFESLYEKESPLTYLKISLDSEYKGFVYIRINKETFWGKQFIFMCSGSNGPSYRNNSFFRSCWKGKPGHHIWAGDYSKGNGKGGESILIDNNPLMLDPKPVHKGLVAARYGYNDKSTIFRIYVKGADVTPKENFSDIKPVEKFAFGNVEEGLDIISHISELPNISRVKIKDSGLILLLS